METSHGGQNSVRSLNGSVTSSHETATIAPADKRSDRTHSDSQISSAENLAAAEETRESSWLLNVVICSGRDLFVGKNTAGDLFCMLHTFDGVSRSKTVRR